KRERDEKVEPRQRSVHGGDLELRLRDRPERGIEARDPLRESRPKRRFDSFGRAEEHEDADDRAHDHVREPTQPDEARMAQLHGVPREPLIVAGGRRKRNAEPLDGRKEAPRGLPDRGEKPREIPEPPADEAMKEKRRAGHDARSREAEQRGRSEERR